jgi:hypothetical protein
LSLGRGLDRNDSCSCDWSVQVAKIPRVLDRSYDTTAFPGLDTLAGEPDYFGEFANTELAQVLDEDWPRCAHLLMIHHSLERRYSIVGRAPQPQTQTRTKRHHIAYPPVGSLSQVHTPLQARLQASIFQCHKRNCFVYNCGCSTAICSLWISSFLVPEGGC